MCLEIAVMQCGDVFAEGGRCRKLHIKCRKKVLGVGYLTIVT
jgi:hypothetical protein